MYKEIKLTDAQKRHVESNIEETQEYAYSVEIQSIEYDEVNNIYRIFVCYETIFSKYRTNQFLVKMRLTDDSIEDFRIFH